MAQDSENRVSSAGDAIPMKKTGVTTYVAIAVGVLAIGAVVVVTTGGKSDPEAERKAMEIKAQASKKEAPGMTAEQQREHLKMTQRAFERAQAEADAKKAEAERQKAAAPEAEAANAPAAPPAGGPAHASAPAPAAGPAQPAEDPAPEPAKPKVTQKAAKKQLDSLDSMGSDIATALE